jgi:predicted DNA repair protein MutK
VKIDWTALGLVSVVSLVATILVVGVAACGIRALDVAVEHEKLGRRAAALRTLGRLCIGVAGLAVLFGIYLIVPALH